MPKSDKGRLPRLIDARDALATAIASCDAPYALPSLCREYRLTLAEIDSIGVKEGIDVVDQLAKRRSAKGPAGATGGA